MFTLRYALWYGAIVLSLLALPLAMLNPHFLWLLAVGAPLALLGTWDVFQNQHAVLRNYPVAAHLRFLFEGLRPELRQYFFESNLSGTPFNREQRSLVYERAKNSVDKMPFGTQLDVGAPGYAWLNHSTAPATKAVTPFRVDVGGPNCAKPYSASVYNISAMSFGALSAHAITALNQGARMGRFAHDTGEGGVSRYHRQGGGDLIWELGSGYFGARHEDGRFNEEMFAEQAADEQIKMLEIKISQGAKPGHGGVLPGPKVTAEIAAARRVEIGVACVSPAAHSAFATPLELLEFCARLRELSGGKPVGFKLCLGHRWEFMAICKAMLETSIRPDFVVVDGAEGGTGAAPVEFSDHLGTPLWIGLNFVHNTLVGANLRADIRLAASGKIVSAFDMVAVMALGADWCNSARGFMFSVGCIQSRSCHTNRCPVGVATQDPHRQRALDVDEKSTRVFNFHRNTVAALTEVIAAAGLEHPRELRPNHLFVRETRGEVIPADKAYTWLQPGELLAGTSGAEYAEPWAMADSASFRPA